MQTKERLGDKIYEGAGRPSSESSPSVDCSSFSGQRLSAPFGKACCMSPTPPPTELVTLRVGEPLLKLQGAKT